MIPEEWSPELATVVGDLLVVVGGRAGNPGRTEFSGHVGGFQNVGVEIAADIARKLVRPALDDQVHPEAAGWLLDVLSSRRHLNLFKVVEVEVRR